MSLLGLFEQMATDSSSGQAEVELVTAQTIRKRPAMGKLQAIGPEWMQTRLDHWDLKTQTSVLVPALDEHFSKTEYFQPFSAK